MKFGDAHKYLPFRKYKFLHEENLPVGETVTQMTLYEGYINTTLMRILHEVHGPTAHRLSFKKREWPSCTHLLVPRSMIV